MVRRIINTAYKLRPYVYVVAYGIVLADVLDLAKEVASEFVFSRFFPQKEVKIYPQVHINTKEFLREETGILHDFENVSTNVPEHQQNGDSSQNNVDIHQFVN